MKKFYVMVVMTIAAFAFTMNANAQKAVITKAPDGIEASHIKAKSIPMSMIKSFSVAAPEKGKKNAWSDWKYYSEGTYNYMTTGVQHTEGLTGPITIYTQEAGADDAPMDSVYNCKFNYGFEGFWDNLFGSVEGYVGPKLVIGKDAVDSLRIDYQESGIQVTLTTGDKVPVLISDGRDVFYPQYVYKYTGYEDQELGVFNLYTAYWAGDLGYFGYGWESTTSEGAWSQWKEEQTGMFGHVFFGDDEAEDPMDNVQEFDDLKCRVSNKSAKYIQIATESWGQGFATRGGAEAMFQINTADNTITVPEFDTGYSFEAEDDNGDTYDFEVYASDVETLSLSSLTWDEYPSTWDPETKTMNLNLCYHAYYPDGFMQDGQDLTGYVTYWYPVSEVFMYTGEFAEPDPTPTPGGLKGDANGDEVVDVADITAIAGYILGETPAKWNADNADANSDNVIDVADITATATIILEN